MGNQQEKWYERAFNTMPLPVILTGLDWVIQGWNPAAECLYGYSAADAAGRNLGSLLKSRFVDGSLERITAQLHLQQEAESEVVHTTAGGIELKLLCTLTLMTDESGNACGYTAVMREQTDGQALEMELRRQVATQQAREQDFMHSLANPREGIYTICFDERKFNCDQPLAQRLASGGISYQEAQELLNGFVAPEDAAAIQASFSECLASRQEKMRFEFKLKPIEPEPCYMFSRCTITYDDAGSPSRIFGIFVDITANKKMAVQLEQRSTELNHNTVQLEADLAAMNNLHRICMRFMEEHDLPLLYDDIVTAALNIMHTDMGALQILNTQTNTLHVITQRGLLQAYVDHVDRIHTKLGSSTPIMKLDSPIIIEDIHRHPMFLTQPTQDLLESAQVRSMVAVPLLSGSGMLLGMLSIHYKQPRTPDERELRIMDLLARLTADIMERARAEAELQNSTQGTELLYEVVEKLLAGGKTQEVIEECCTKVMKFLHCDLFMNYLNASDKTHLRLHCHNGLPHEEEKLLRWVDRSKVVSGMVVSSGGKLVVEDIQNSSDPRTALLRSMGLRSLACHPLAVQNEILGTLAFATKSMETFTSNELALMKAVSDHVAVALHRQQNEEALKRMTEEISDKNRLITNFFTNISHEFKTPLSIILVDLQLMEYRLKDADSDTRDKLGKMVMVMRQNALRLLRLIGNLLDVTKIDAGFMKVRLVTLDVVELVGNLVESVHDYAENAELSISFNSSMESRLMPVDSEKMERILLNLFSNAIKHTQEGGHIQVSLTHSESAITICVKDDGEGIPQDKQEYMFDRFRQANTSLTRSSEGCGIGLSLTKALVELLHGKVWFESCLGQGSEFFVELPVLKTKEPAKSPVIEGMPRSRKVEMEFSDIHKVVKQY